MELKCKKCGTTILLGLVMWASVPADICEDCHQHHELHGHESSRPFYGISSVSGIANSAVVNIDFPWLR